MATVAGPTATTYNPQGSTRYFGPLQPNHKSQSGRLHDRWTEGTGEDDGGLQTEYGERSRNARAPMHVGMPRRMPLTVTALPTPCVCGNYALALDAGGTWLDFAFAGGGSSGGGGSGASIRDTITELLMEHNRRAQPGTQRAVRAELEALALPELKQRARLAGMAVEVLAEAQMAAAPSEPMYMSLATRSGTYRFKAGHNAGMMVCEFGKKGKTGYQRERGHTFAALAAVASRARAGDKEARAQAGAELEPGQYRFGEKGQWVVTLEPSGQVAITFFAAHRLGGGPIEEYYWADPTHEFAGTNGAQRQAGRLILRPDGGFHESSAEPAHASVQQLAHGRVAMGGDDLTRYDDAAARKAKYKNHQHFGGKAPFHVQEALDRSLVDPDAPGGKLLHSSAHGATLDSRQARVSSKDCKLHNQETQAPWALHEEVDPHALSQAWAAADGIVPPARNEADHSRLKATDLAPSTKKQNLPGAAPNWW